MTSFDKKDLERLQKALGSESAISSDEGLEKIKNRWSETKVNIDDKNDKANSEDVFKLIDKLDGDGWVETTDAIFIRHVEIDGNSWWNLSEFLRNPNNDQKEYKNLPNDFPILSAEIAKDEKTNLHITHIDGDKYQVTKIIENEGESALAEEVSFLGISQSDKNYKILYKVFWVIKDKIPQQYCSRFVGFKRINEGEKND